MSRREFSKLVKRDAFKRADGKCEGVKPDGELCEAKLSAGKFHYDHDIADGLGGEPELWNCKVLCTACHKVKTNTHDIPLIAKVKRIQDGEKGIRKPSTMKGGGFQKAGAQRSASRPLERKQYDGA